MKNLLVVIAVMFAGQTFAQNTPEANTGIARPVLGAHWHQGVKGKCAKTVHYNVSSDGKYNVTWNNETYIAIVDVVLVDQTQVLFGQYADWNRNWVDLEGGEKVFIFYKKGSEIETYVESILNKNYTNFLGKYLSNEVFQSKVPLTLAKCGNDVQQARFIGDVVLPAETITLTQTVVVRDTVYLPAPATNVVTPVAPVNDVVYYDQNTFTQPVTTGCNCSQNYSNVNPNAGYQNYNNQQPTAQEVVYVESEPETTWWNRHGDAVVAGLVGFGAGYALNEYTGNNNGGLTYTTYTGGNPIVGGSNVTGGNIITTGGTGVGGSNTGN